METVQFPIPSEKVTFLLVKQLPREGGREVGREGEGEALEKAGSEGAKERRGGGGKGGC
jgi:hypothetical protein